MTASVRAPVVRQPGAPAILLLAPPAAPVLRPHLPLDRFAVDCWPGGIRPALDGAP